MVTAVGTAPALDPEVNELIAEKRARQRGTLRGRAAWALVSLGGGFIAAASALALMVDSERTPGLLLLVSLVTAYALASRVEFEVGAGAAVATQLVLVPMLFLLPLGLVPFAVAGGLMLGNLMHHLRGAMSLERVGVPLVSAWHAVGPVLVLAAFGESAPAWDRWWVYVLALASQFVFDFANAAAFEWLALGVSPLSRSWFAEVYLVDLGLSPVALLVAFAAFDEPAAIALVVPLIALLGYFARERRSRIDHALELSNAYKGTAFLLGDVVEADDAYTGSHSRHVVDLVLAVSDELGLDARGRRDAEFVALLHDVGKIRVPSEIINKPGKLDEAEWAVVKRHTIEGERMLAGVGGLLAQVGAVVRSCHERWDGGGYPDGLAGEEIPLIARIVMACDAYSAMTTDRAYRAAMSKEDAIAELLVNSGTQFDPRVVRALVRLETR